MADYTYAQLIADGTVSVTSGKLTAVSAPGFAVYSFILDGSKRTTVAGDVFVVSETLAATGAGLFQVRFASVTPLVAGTASTTLEVHHYTGTTETAISGLTGFAADGTVGVRQSKSVSSIAASAGGGVIDANDAIAITLVTGGLGNGKYLITISGFRV